MLKFDVSFYVCFIFQQAATVVDHIGALAPSPCKKPRLSSSLSLSEKTNLKSELFIKKEAKSIKMVII